MKSKVLIICLCTISLSAYHSFVALPLYRMTGRADLIVRGNIVAVNESTYSFQIEDVLSGKNENGMIEVRKYNGWPSQERWTPYKSHQKLVLFLQKLIEEKTNKVIWIIWGAGDEGEMPIQGKYVYCSYLTLKLPNHDPETFEIFGKTFRGQEFDYTLFADAVRNYKKCFKIDRPKRVINQLCDDEYLEFYRRASPIHELLVAQTEEIIERLKKIE